MQYVYLLENIFNNSIYFQFYKQSCSLLPLIFILQFTAVWIYLCMLHCLTLKKILLSEFIKLILVYIQKVEIYLNYGLTCMAPQILFQMVWFGPYAHDHIDFLGQNRQTIELDLSIYLAGSQIRLISWAIRARIIYIICTLWWIF